MSGLSKALSSPVYAGLGFILHVKTAHLKRPDHLKAQRKRPSSYLPVFLIYHPATSEIN